MEASAQAPAGLMRRGAVLGWAVILFGRLDGGGHGAMQPGIRQGARGGVHLCTSTTPHTQSQGGKPTPPQ